MRKSEIGMRKSEIGMRKSECGIVWRAELRTALNLCVGAGAHFSACFTSRKDGGVVSATGDSVYAKQDMHLFD